MNAGHVVRGLMGACARARITYLAAEGNVSATHYDANAVRVAPERVFDRLVNLIVKQAFTPVIAWAFVSTAIVSILFARP